MAMAVLRGLPPLDLPVAGRSSDESLGNSMAALVAGYGSISPVISFEMLATLKCLWLFNPDFSQYVANIVNLGNPGHSLSVEATTDAIAERAVERLNESASRIYLHGSGVDGLLDAYLTSVAWSGAISSEDVVNIVAGRVEKVVLVPVEQIRFKYDKVSDRYEAYQKTSNIFRRDTTGTLGLIKLNTETYRYFALSTVENSPYAKPPATAAVEPIVEAQKPLMENLRFIAQKFGLLGLVTAGVTPPRKSPMQSDGEYKIAAEQYLAKVVKTLESGFTKGLVASYKDIELKHTNVAEGATGLYDANRISEEQIMSGLGQPPAFFGRTDSTTETYADVVYHLLEAQMQKVQRIAKRRQERTYRLDLRLGGIEVDAVSLQFNKAHSRNAKAEAETNEIKFRDVLARVKAGAITPDEGAQELGYDSWADDALLFQQTGVAPKAETQQPSLTARRTLTLKFDKASQSYRHQPETIEIWSGERQDAIGGNDKIVPFALIKKKAQSAALN